MGRRSTARGQRSHRRCAKGGTRRTLVFEAADPGSFGMLSDDERVSGRRRGCLRGGRARPCFVREMISRTGAAFGGRGHHHRRRSAGASPRGSRASGRPGRVQGTRARERGNMLSWAVRRPAGVEGCWWRPRRVHSTPRRWRYPVPLKLFSLPRGPSRPAGRTPRRWVSGAGSRRRSLATKAPPCQAAGPWGEESRATKGRRRERQKGGTKERGARAAEWREEGGQQVAQASLAAIVTQPATKPRSPSDARHDM